MIRQWLQLFFDRRYSSVALQNPDFIKIAEGFGVPGEKISSPADLDQALERMLDAEGPYMLHIMVEKEENIFPMVPAGSTPARSEERRVGKEWESWVAGAHGITQPGGM